VRGTEGERERGREGERGNLELVLHIIDMSNVNRCRTVTHKITHRIPQRIPKSEYPSISIMTDLYNRPIITDLQSTTLCCAAYDSRQS